VRLRCLRCLRSREVRSQALTTLCALLCSEDDVHEIQKEIAVLSQCRSPHVTRYIGTPAAYLLLYHSL
jgi:hypothetical protein